MNNAGDSPSQMPLTELPREAWDATLALNVTAIFSATRIAAHRMAAGGRIIDISSIAASRW